MHSRIHRNVANIMRVRCLSLRSAFVYVTHTDPPLSICGAYFFYASGHVFFFLIHCVCDILQSMTKLMTVRGARFVL